MLRWQLARPLTPAAVIAAAATEAPPAPSTAREQLSFERYEGPGITVEVSLEGGRYQVG